MMNNAWSGWKLGNFLRVTKLQSTDQFFADRYCNCIILFLNLFNTLPHQAMPEVSVGGKYNPEEHVPIESFVTTLSD